ncbi:uncharacterized protein [Ptychodera flava]|uniref:uncharacterized protein n=1 Tax=Ptychodera flava TaxID=63121 RepID=UPI003969F882
MTTSNRAVTCRRYSYLRVRGFDSHTVISLPTTYSLDYIPVEESHIPTPDIANEWPHLRQIAHLVQPLKKCEVGLLIGYDCPQALAPRSCINGEGNQPFAVETDLGWSIVGQLTQSEDDKDVFSVTHRILTKTIPDNIQPSVNTDGHLPQDVCYAFKTSAREQFIEPSDIVKILESDFNETRAEDVTMSQEDIRFMRIIENSISKETDGFYTMPLPFKRDKPPLPNNKSMAEQRLQYLRRRFKSNPKYRNDYMQFMQDIITAGDAELVNEQEQEDESTWYIPHHGVYHPKKPGKIRVVFDCSARFRGTSLNDHLLQGPDQMNPLIGVLCRFRKENVAIMCDIERMFHRFRVNEDDRDYLRFLWWKDSDFDSKPATYRMKVHLFGAVSSPGCANYGLKQVAKDNPQYGEKAVNFVSRNFYVDDGLESLESSQEAIQLIKNVRNLCAEGNLRLHKFISNDRTTMESVPISERAKNVKDLDLSFNELPIERALGIEWCAESDTFHFSPVVKEHTSTRRGILSAVASVFDPLGFLAPFVLRGKRILQEMCKKGTEWDDPLPDDLRPKWESWLSELR